WWFPPRKLLLPWLPQKSRPPLLSRTRLPPLWVLLRPTPPLLALLPTPLTLRPTLPRLRKMPPRLLPTLLLAPLPPSNAYAASARLAGHWQGTKAPVERPGLFSFPACQHEKSHRRRWLFWATNAGRLKLVTSSGRRSARARCAG